jgi:hypothetical protein
VADVVYPPIQPGDFVEAPCPAGAVPLVKEGQLWPSATDAPPTAAAAPEGQPQKVTALLSVVKVRDNVAVLGPLKAGEYSGDFDCSDGSKAPFAYALKQPNKDELPEHAGPVSPSALAYPWWYWLVLLGILLALVGVGFGVERWVRSRGKPKKKRKKEAPPPPPPDEALKAFLRESEKSKWTESGDPKIVRETYVRAYDLLRSYLEFRLAFSAGADTTREFTGSFKSALAVQPHFQARLRTGPGLVDSLLTQADQVRFAGEMPDAETRRGFQASLREVFDAFLAAPPPPSKKPTAPPKGGKK